MSPELEAAERALRRAREIEQEQRGRFDRQLDLLASQQVWKGTDARDLTDALIARKTRLHSALHRIVGDLEQRVAVLRHNQP